MKKVMVYGGGVSGMAALKLLEKNGYETILVDDNKAMTKEEALKSLDGIELFVKSPGIAYNELTNKVVGLGIEMIDEIELAYRLDKSNAKIIAITGTNGKTTTTSKIAGLLEAAGFEVEAGGNIGKPYAQIVLEEKALDYIVLELSSYQLENLKEFKADIAMILNLSPDHLARYESLEEYYLSKVNIANNQNPDDIFILNIDSKELIDLNLDLDSQILRVSSKGKEADIAIANRRLYYKGDEVLECDKLSLKGKHNLENITFITAVAKWIGIDNSIVQNYLYTTRSLEHRMEEFYTWKSVEFINDSKGTNVDSTIKAIEAFDKKPILIAGGKDKYVDLAPLAKVITKSCKALYLIGETADKVEELVRNEGYNEVYNYGSIERVVEELKVEGGDIVLFSPAHSSFDQFKNYIVRGDIFKELIIKKFR